MKHLLYTLCAFLLVTSLKAATITAKANGDWETKTIWNPSTRIPADGDTIIIPLGDTVLVTSNVGLNDVVIIVYGVLDLSTSGKLKLDIDSKVIIQAGGRLKGNSNDDQLQIGNDIKWKGSEGDVIGPKYTDNNSTGFDPWVVLSVNFQSFYVIRQGTNIQIFWSTSEEVNNAYYAIEKSTDGQSWKQVATIAGAGTSATINKYTYTDKNVTDAVAYYRLRQVDKNGAANYSTVRVVRYNEATVANIYASSNKTVVVDFNSGIKDNVSIQLINMSGQVIVRKEFNQASYRLVVNAMSAGSGVYAVRVSDSKGWSEVKKIAL